MKFLPHPDSKDFSTQGKIIFWLWILAGIVTPLPAILFGREFSGYSKVFFAIFIFAMAFSYIRIGIIGMMYGKTRNIYPEAIKITKGGSIRGFLLIGATLLIVALTYIIYIIRN